LIEHALRVKNLTSPDAPSYVGLWLSARTAQQLSDPTTCLEFRDWLSAAGLIPYTLNGFPYGDFHQSVVKHQVYQPSWAEESRLEYTLQLSSILDDLLPKGVSGTISTLPLGWPASNGNNEQDFFRRCAQNLKGLANELAELRARTGRLIVVCIEPEPGCILESADDIIGFFADYLGNDPGLRAHLGVCHDICHSAVMYEQQAQAIDAYQKANVLIGKVQISSAVSIDFEQLTISDRELALSQLEEFAEPRYLHQTVWKSAGQKVFFEDLPLAIPQVRKSGLSGEVRVHFHVPVFADQLGLLSTTQHEIGECLKALRKSARENPFPHFEVETYAWNVLPATWRPSSLAEGIAQELGWLKSQLIE
jgi:sugar phosphate isomerase/epimerase